MWSGRTLVILIYSGEGQDEDDVNIGNSQEQYQHQRGNRSQTIKREKGDKVRQEGKRGGEGKGPRLDRLEARKSRLIQVLSGIPNGERQNGRAWTGMIVRRDSAFAFAFAVEMPSRPPPPTGSA